MKKIIVIKNIVFYNPENHFCIFKDLNDLTFQGNIFSPYKMQKIEVDTEEIQTNYGKQEKIIQIKYYPPTNDNIIYLLSSGLINKIGIKTAEKILTQIKNFNDFWAELKNIHLLNISENIKYNFYKKMSFYKNFIEMHEDFFKNGFNYLDILKINELFGDKSLFYLKNNPYIYFNKIPNITFKFLDSVAQNYSLSLHSKDRILAGTYSCIDDYCNEYKCSFIEFNDLYSKGYNFLEIDDGVYFATLNNLIDDKLLYEININDKLFITTPEIYNTEYKTFIHLKRLFNPLKAQNNFLHELPDFLSENQKNAIQSLLENKISILTGIPGSGKTTIINYAINLYKKQNPQNIVQIGTPTGKSAQRVRETTTENNVATNHKMLRYLPNGDFIFNESNKLDIDLLVLDETSMVDMFMFYNILSSLHTHTQIWIIGDYNQLESISLGNILEDLINSKLFSHYHLNEVFRQNSNSEILKNAIKCLTKEPLSPTGYDKNKDFYIFEKTAEQDIYNKTIELIFKIKQNKNQDWNDIQILCPQKNSICGTININNVIQEIQQKNNNFFKWKDKKFYIGDKIIQTVNDYDRNIFNGDVGYIKSIDPNNYLIIASFDNQDVLYEKNQIEELELAYALTIHKFQGSEAKTIIIPITKSFYRMISPKLMYTSMTRAISLLVLIGDIDFINSRIQENHDIKRETLLNIFLKEFNNEESNSLF